MQNKGGKLPWGLSGNRTSNGSRWVLQWSCWPRPATVGSSNRLRIETLQSASAAPCPPCPPCEPLLPHYSPDDANLKGWSEQNSKSDSGLGSTPGAVRYG